MCGRSVSYTAYITIRCTSVLTVMLIIKIKFIFDCHFYFYLQSTDLFVLMNYTNLMSDLLYSLFILW